MSYRDEELLRLRQKAEAFRKEQTAEETIEKECEQSIYDPVVYIMKIPVEFRERNLLEDQLTMRIPVDFELLPPEVIQKLFLMDNKPQYVYENPYLPLGLAFNLTQVTLSGNKLDVLYPYMISALKKIGPGVHIISEDKRIISDMEVRMIEYTARTLRDTTYNTQFLLNLNGRLLIANLNCSSVYMKRYKPIMQEMVQSIQILKPNAGGEHNDG